MYHSYYFMIFQYKLLINLLKILGKKTKTDKNIKKIIIFCNFEPSSYQSRPQNEIKTIGNGTKCDTIIILCSFNIRHC